MLRQQVEIETVELKIENMGMLLSFYTLKIGVKERTDRQNDA